MSDLDYTDSVTITITKVKHDGEPSHWDLTIEKSGESEELGGGTAPTFAGIYDMAYSIIAGGDKHSNYEYNDWVFLDANKRD